MKIHIQTPGFKAQNKLMDYVTAHISTLAASSSNILEAQVVLKLCKPQMRENKVCELRVVIPGNDFFAQKQCSSFEEAVLHCKDAIEHQVRRWKDSQDHGKRRGSQGIDMGGVPG